MKRNSITLLITALMLSACGTLYSKSRDFKLPAGLGKYVITAQIDAGLFVRHATILVNDREVLSGQSFFWSDTIEMSGKVDQFPISAICEEKAKTCEVSIAGIHAVDLRF